MSKGKITFWIFAGIVGFSALLVGGKLLGLRWELFYGTRKRDVEREKFEQSQSFIRGKRERLLKLYNEWQSADAKERQGLETVIQSEFANFNGEKHLESEKLINFLKERKGLK